MRAQLQSKIRRLLTWAAFAGAPLGSLASQAPESAPLAALPANSRLSIRMRAPNEKVIGTLLSVGADSVVLGPRSGKAPVTIPLSQVTSVLRYTGKRSHWLAGMALGALTGLTMGELYAAGNGSGSALATDVCGGLEAFGFYSKGGCHRDAQTASGNTDLAIGLLTGAAVGAAIGALGATNEWREVKLPRRAHVVLSPTRNGVSLQARLRL